MSSDSISAPETERIDLPMFLRHMRRERETAVIIHGRPLSGKTNFARRLAQQPGFSYLNILEELAGQPDLAARVDQFDVLALKKLLMEVVERPENLALDVLLVDGMDFLFPVWTAGELPAFQEVIRKLSHPGRAVAFGLFVQDRPEWTNWLLQTAGRKSRIISFDTIKPLSETR